MNKDNELIVLEEVKYPATVTELEAFKEEWAIVPVLIPENGIKDPDYLELKKAKFKAIKFRTSIEKTRVQLKSPALEYGKKVDSIAKEMKEIVGDTETKLVAECLKVEQYEQLQEQKRIDAEQERVRKLGDKITQLSMIPSNAIGKSHAELLKLYESIKIPEVEYYQERTEEAVQIYKDIIIKLENMIETTLLAETAAATQAAAEEKRKKEDAERDAKLKEEREAFEAEKRAFQEMQDKAAREAAAEVEEAKRLEAEKEAEEFAKQQEEDAIREAKEAEEKAAAALAKEDEYYAKCEKETTELFEYMIHEADLTSSEIVQEIIAGRVPHVTWEFNNVD